MRTGRPKGSKNIQKTYNLPEYVYLNTPIPDKYVKETKLRFIDSRFGEFISSIKAMQDAGGSTHPKAIVERRNKTMLEKYGVENASLKPEFRRKAEATMKAYYGSEHALQSDRFKDKAKETLMENYGVEHNSQSQEVLDKRTTTFIERYGVDNPGKLNTKTILPNGMQIKSFAKQQGCEGKSHTARKIFQHDPIAAQQYIEDNKNFRSYLETTTERLFSSIKPISCDNKKVIPEINYRPDFRFEQNPNVFLDVDGLFHHSEEHKKPDYHKIKREAYENQGKTLIQLRCDEIIEKSDLCLSILKAKLGLLDQKVNTRELTISINPEGVSQFLDENHMMGCSRGATALALVNKAGVIQSVLTYRRLSEGIVDIVRFCNRKHTKVPGALSKLLKYIEENIEWREIQYFVDLRYGSGKSVVGLGFNLESIHTGFRWTDKKRTFPREYCKANMDERGLSEREYAEEMGLVRIYDAGQAKFVKRK